MKKITSKNKKNKFDRQGFLMIEAAFSIFIVGVILITFLAVMGSVYRTEFAKRNHVVAANLAQEGIEIVRNIRDNNWKNGDNAFDAPFPAGPTYCVDYLGTVGVCANTLNKNANNFYGYAAGDMTRFSRNIVISGVGDSRLVTVTVTWNGNSIVLSDTLYAWGDVD